MVIKFFISVCIMVCAFDINANEEGGYFFQVGFTGSKLEAAASEAMGGSESFEETTAISFGFSSAFFDDYEIGFFADFYEKAQDIENINYIFGTRNSRFIIHNDTIRGQVNGQDFEYAEQAYIWYTNDTFWNRFTFNGLIYGSYTTLITSASYDPAVGISSYYPAEITYFGIYSVYDRLDHKVRGGWDTDGDVGFVFLNVEPDSSYNLTGGSTIAHHGNIRLGYYMTSNNVKRSMSGPSLFVGLNMRWLFDIGFEYYFPITFGPSVMYSHRW